MFYFPGNEQCSARGSYGITQAFAFVWSTLTMQGCNVMPDQSSSRIAFATVLCTSMALYYYWESSLISYVAERKISLPIKTLSEFELNPGKYKVPDV